MRCKCELLLARLPVTWKGDLAAAEAILDADAGQESAETRRRSSPG